MLVLRWRFSLLNPGLDLPAADREIDTRKKTEGWMSQIYQHALPTGVTLESYEIKDVLGMGGFGITYRAYDHSLECEVAIKEYLPSMFAVRTPDGTTVTPKSDGDEKSYGYGLKRFLDEARILAKFREPNIVRVLRFLEANHTAYLVMDYENGEPLSDKLKREITLPESTIRDIIVPILLSLRSIHAKQYLHRDIKPANINIRKDGSPVLLDFGAARQALENQSRVMTRMVTPGYAPFEQYSSNSKQGPWTDIYAIGATMYHCAVGVAPTNATERIAALQDDEPDPIDQAAELMRGKFSRPFLQAMTWMLAPNVKDRPQTVDEVLAAMQQIESERSTKTKSSPIPRTTKSAGTTDAASDATLLFPMEGDNGFLPQENETPSTGSPPPARHTASTTLDPQELLTAAEHLAAYLGPLAKVLVKQAAAKASDRNEFYRLLADELTNTQEKEAFLRAVNKSR
jgi:serine/threonine protein kinase